MPLATKTIFRFINFSFAKHLHFSLLDESQLITANFKVVQTAAELRVPSSVFRTLKLTKYHSRP
jgi:hypothetical protein